MDAAHRLALGAVMLSFGALGLAGSVAGTLVPAVREVFGLGLSAAMAVQWIALVGVGVSSIPLAHLMQRIGFARMAVLALATSLFGCLAVTILLMPQFIALPSYGLFLAALLVLSIGGTALQMSINPLAAMLGEPRLAASRVTVAQGVNSAGLLLAVVLSSVLVLARTGLSAPGQPNYLMSGMALVYLISAALTGAVLIFTALVFRPASLPALAQPARTAGTLTDALRDRWARSGSLAIAAYVGAEGAIGGLLTSYLHQPHVLDLSMKTAGFAFASIYCGGMIAGRLLGGFLMRVLNSTRLLAGVSLSAAACCLIVVLGNGFVAGTAALLIGPLNAIMFPVIFSTTLDRSGAPSSVVSGLLVFATSGGAAVSALAGWIGESQGVSAAFIVPLCAYCMVARFAYRALQAD
ncbi:MAG: MFS transporter [Betaproteobacteria bacterium]|nr:MFS transporter [Betaproteobacteria bacterium]